MEAQNSDYSDRIVVFIDILGFGGMVDESIQKDGTTNKKNLSTINEAIDILHATWDPPFEGFDIKKEITLFSDSAIISFSTKTRSEVFYTLLKLLHLILDLLRIGVLIRGGIAIGKCIHNKDKVFGPGVNQAVKMEKEANYPRIIVDPKIIDVAKKYHASHHSATDEIESIEKLLKKDDDGLLYLNYFRSAFSEFDDEYSLLEYIFHMYKLINSKQAYYKNNERILNKYIWMQKKYNEMVEPMISKQQINRALKYNPIIAKELQSLKLIS
jgi:hypothetical protein